MKLPDQEPKTFLESFFDCLAAFFSLGDMAGFFFDSLDVLLSLVMLCAPAIDCYQDNALRMSWLLSGC
ncbi:hypothetical protein A8C75_18130 [Marinobacterium aestuarii]|uniref:Uncharacterized protein n=1 Tax=Marinobacterium aestuarii TaxID=1821621 RepID=A0A1A9F279_9GAMM|nr:hypothetical protein A8C75_18130 [Marinobacterium aestuarii]